MPTNGAAQILVSTAAELQAAYATLSTTAGGGTIIIAEGADPLAIKLRDGGDEHVTITSENSDNPSDVTEISITYADNITVTGVAVDSTGVDRADSIQDITVAYANNVTISDSTFTSIADSFYDPYDPTSLKGEDLGIVSFSNGVTFSNNTVTDYGKGINFVESTGLTVTDNHMVGFQMDVLAFGAAQDVLIAGNHIEYLYGSHDNHDDMIQFWTGGAQMESKNITISDNVLIANGEAATQSIFIRNEGHDLGQHTWLYQNITITNNLIYNGHTHGVTVMDANNVDVSGNTVLWNDYSETAYFNAQGEVEGVTLMPAITLDNISNGTLTNNISGAYNISGSVAKSGNVTVNYTDSSNANYIGNNIINAEQGGDVTVLDLSTMPDSAWNNAGSTLGHLSPYASSAEDVAVMRIFQAPGDVQELVFDATLSRSLEPGTEAEDYTYEWTFSDGTTAEGAMVAVKFADHGWHDATLTVRHEGSIVDTVTTSFDVQSATFVDIDFENGLQDASPYDSTIFDGDESSIVSSADGSGYWLGGDALTIARENMHLHNLDSFGLSFDLHLEDTDTKGIFVQFYNTFEAELHDDGSVSFALETTDGTFSVSSGPDLLSDGDPHRLGFSFDNQSGQLVMHVDGEEVDAVHATGETPSLTHYGLNFGKEWGTSIDAVVDNINFGDAPVAASETLPPLPPPPKPDPEPDPDPAPEPDPDPAPTNTGDSAPKDTGADDPTLADVLTDGTVADIEDYLSGRTSRELLNEIEDMDLAETLDAMSPAALRTFLNGLNDGPTEDVIDDIGGDNLLLFLSKFADNAENLLNALDDHTQQAFLDAIQGSDLYGDADLLGRKLVKTLEGFEDDTGSVLDGNAPLPEVPVEENDPAGREEEEDGSRQRDGGGGFDEALPCFVATAAYQDITHADVDYLRQVRDRVLMHSAAGRAFIWTYWRVGPSLARLVEVVPGARGPSRRLLERMVRAMQDGALLDRHGKEARDSTTLKYRR